MRKLLGCAVLALGVGGLGWVAMSRDAPRIQMQISAAAQSVAQSDPSDIAVAVSGRDVRVSGVVTDDVERARLLNTFQSLDGVRVVDVGGVETLPLADPFELIATLDTTGEIAVSGAVPDASTLAAFGAGSELILSAGVPDSDWAGIAKAGVAGLALLQSGTLTLTDRDIGITGRAATPRERDAATAFLEGLPEGYSASVDIEVEDDGTPLRLTAERAADGMVTASGKLPSDLPVAQVLAGADATQVVQATIPATDADWPDAARSALNALRLLKDGRLTFEDRQITLTGSATPDGKSEAEAVMRSVSEGYDVAVNIALWDDGAPLTLTMTWDGVQAVATGKRPAGMDLRGPAGVAVSDESTASFLPDTQGDFSRNVTAGVTALGLLENGTLTVEDSDLILTGTAATPQVSAVLDSVLSNVANGTQVRRDITFADDGSPAAWTLTFDIASGARIVGRLQNGLEASQIAQVLGLDAVEGTAGTAQSDSDSGSTLEALRIAADYLPEVENMVYTRDADGSALNLILSPGVDIDLVAADLAQRLPGDVAFSLAPLVDLPEAGSTRRNSLSGLTEEFRGGFWLPVVDFSTDVAGCNAQSEAVLTGAKITFLSSSARLDATSIRAINALAAVAQPCIAAGLNLEIGGHTDATGNADQNQALSLERAVSVRAALVERGLPVDAMTAQGFGQTQPIAENSTPEGRSANRRTSLTWTAP